MKRTLRPWFVFCLEVALSTLWLVRGMEGAGNVFTVLVWMLMITALYSGMSDKAQADMASRGEVTNAEKTRTFVRVVIAGALVWCNHIAIGVLYLVAAVMLAAARDKAVEDAAIKAARNANEAGV